jgi:hypothetical protein
MISSTTRSPESSWILLGEISFPQDVASKWLVQDVRPKQDLIGHHFIIHHSFVVPSHESFNFQSTPIRNVRYAVEPKIEGFDENFADLDSNE